MLAIAICYLNGWAMAAEDGARKEKAEWPPHPDRVFMAFAAAYFETDGTADERAVLEWLETLPPPSLSASDALKPEAVITYVPTNDSTTDRTRQPRSFPKAIPQNPVVHLIWPDAEAGVHRSTLNALCRKVTYIGHSASFVQSWVDDSPPDASWVPESVQAMRNLRVPSGGRLDQLEKVVNRKACVEYAELEFRKEEAKGKEKSALKREIEERFPYGEPVSHRPSPGMWQGYARKRAAPRPEIRGTAFDPRITVLALKGLRPDLRATLKLTETLRCAMLAGCPEPIPEWVSGHGKDGKASINNHMAIFPLPFVGSDHADGRILGLGLAFPRNLPEAEAGKIFAAWFTGEGGFPRELRLYDGKFLECGAELEERETPPLNLRVETWTKPARCWASVTPLVLDRHFDGKNRWEIAAEGVKDSCERIGLPRPVEVHLHPVSRVLGVPSARDFAFLCRKDGSRRQHSHAVILFEEEVCGPILIGAGRHRGYGFFRPQLQEGS